MRLTLLRGGPSLYCLARLHHREHRAPQSTATESTHLEVNDKGDANVKRRVRDETNPLASVRIHCALVNSSTITGNNRDRNSLARGMFVDNPRGKPGHRLPGIGACCRITCCSRGLHRRKDREDWD